MRPFVIYHGNCADGFGAAWVLWKHFKGKADFYPGVYQRRPPTVTDREVYFVDFSYKRQDMIALARRNVVTVVLDHHKTAKADLLTDDSERVWQAPDPRAVNFDNFDQDYDRGDMFTVFDMERSGAGIAWDFFNPGQPRPALINHIEDRDLWRFKLPRTREIQASMFALPYIFEVWDQRFEHFDQLRPSIVLEGEAIERKHFKDIEELCAVVTRPMAFRTSPHDDGLERTVVPAANLPYTMTSDTGHMLCERNWYGLTREAEDEYLRDGGAPRNSGSYEHPFAACYWDKPDGRQFSLRSRDDGADVGEIAKLYGGGGHARASGFLVPYDRLAEFEP